MKFKNIQLLVASLVLSVFSSSAHSSEKVSLETEMRSVEADLRKEEINFKETENLRKYLEVLSCIGTSALVKDMHGVGFQKHPGKISKNMLQRLKAAVTTEGAWGLGEASSQDICLFFDFVESLKPGLKASSPRHMPIHLPLSNGQSKKLILTTVLNPRPKLFVDFEKKVEQEGACKTFQPALEYKLWKPVAQLKFKCDGLAARYLRHEADLLHKLDSLPQGKRTGLADLLGYNSSAIFQSLYDSDLFAFVETTRVNYRQKLEIVSQLASGLASLHSLGILHNDIKFENVLIKVKTGQDLEATENYEAILTDFGLSEFPRERIENNLPRPFIGTFYTMAPEVGTDWRGHDTERKIANALKADLYSLAILTGALMDYGFFDNLLRCDDFDSHSAGRSCRSQLILAKMISWPEIGTASPLHELLRKSLDPNPSDRIDAREFQMEIQKIKESAEAPYWDTKEFQSLWSELTLDQDIQK